MSRSVDIRIKERRKKPTQGRHRRGKSIFKEYQGVFYLLQTTHKPHFIYNLTLLLQGVFSFHTRTYYFSEFLLLDRGPMARVK